MKWPDDVTDENILSAISVNFAIDPVFAQRLEQLERDGFIRKVWSWELTEKGEQARNAKG
jgi:hypothetical protein